MSVASILRDGFKTLVSLGSSGEGGINLYEKTVTPPGVDGTGGIDITTMRNTLWRTKAPKALITLTEATFVAAYNPIAYNTILSYIQVNTQITIYFPNSGALTFWGFLDKFKPGELKEGEQPTAEVTIVPSNVNASWAEAAPSYTGPSLKNMAILKLAKKQYEDLVKSYALRSDVKEYERQCALQAEKDKQSFENAIQLEKEAREPEDQKEEPASEPSEETKTKGKSPKVTEPKGGVSGTAGTPGPDVDPEKKNLPGKN